MSVNDFNDNKDLEVMTFRRNTMLMCQNTIEERASRGPHGNALYIYPPDVHSNAVLPPHIKQTVEKGLPCILQYLFITI
jgi:phosphatidylinositol-4,5-bisphosphate 3-kinase catalytic subunit alpha/beta/delta